MPFKCIGSTTRMDLNKAEGCYQSMLLQEHRMRCSKTFGCCCVPRYLRRHGYRSHSPLSACEGGASMQGNHRKRGLSSPLPPVIALTSRPGRKASLPSFIAFSLWKSWRSSKATVINEFLVALTNSMRLATSLGSAISLKEILIALFPFFTFTQEWVCAETLLWGDLLREDISMASKRVRHLNQLTKCLHLDSYSSLAQFALLVFLTHGDEQEIEYIFFVLKEAKLWASQSLTETNTSSKWQSDGTYNKKASWRHHSLQET